MKTLWPLTSAPSLRQASLFWPPLFVLVVGCVPRNNRVLWWIGEHIDKGLQVSGELRVAQLCQLPPSPVLPPPLGPDQSINALQAATPPQRSPSASLHCAYGRLAGLISKIHPAPRLQAAAGCEPSALPAGSVCPSCQYRRAIHHSDWLWGSTSFSSGNSSALMKHPAKRDPRPRQRWWCQRPPELTSSRKTN